jgi:sulfatase maturation enzyme AslB (radical SAM superfamily)
MKFSELSLVVTDDCNYRCSYCLQKKEKKYMSPDTIEKAVTFFYPLLTGEASITFYGGEPLLAFDHIKYAVSLLINKKKKQEKKLGFYLTTNGSLVTDEMLHFFDRYRFDVMLSFDGLAQEIAREPGSLIPTQKLIQRMLSGSYPGIEFSTNSVFSPATVNHLSASLQYIIETGVTDIQFDLAGNIPWDEASLSALEKELAGLSDFLVSYYKENRTIPVNHFRVAKPNSKNKKNTGFVCAAGRDRMAITPEGYVWGCAVFHDYMKTREDIPDFHLYSFRKLDDFIKNHETIYPRILANHIFLSQDCFVSADRFCFLCDEVGTCRVCPVNAAYTTSVMGKISPWVCRLNGILKKETNGFREEIARIGSSL